MPSSYGCSTWTPVLSFKLSDAKEVFLSVKVSPDFMISPKKEEEIAEAYRRGYSEHPQEEWVGKLGPAFLKERLKGEPPV
jgi:hypothetical protein